MTEKILVTGANGQLGKCLQDITKENENIIFTDIITDERVSKLDITDIDSVRNFVHENNVILIVNCAAYTNVEKAEGDYEMAELLNSTAPLNLATVMKEVDGTLIHISTDYVFGKEPYNRPCTEDQEGTPIGVYGLTKKHGEENIINSGCKYYIIRTAWLYSEYGNNFVKTMLKLMSTKDSISVVNNQIGTPTYAHDLAVVIMEFIYNPSIEKGIYHFSNEGCCSWYDFSKHIAKITNKKIEIIPCSDKVYPSNVKRPAYSVLDKTKIKSAIGEKYARYWVDALEECITNFSSI